MVLGWGQTHRKPVCISVGVGDGGTGGEKGALGPRGGRCRVRGAGAGMLLVGEVTTRNSGSGLAGEQ